MAHNSAADRKSSLLASLRSAHKISIHKTDWHICWHCYFIIVHQSVNLQQLLACTILHYYCEAKTYVVSCYYDLPQTRLHPPAWQIGWSRMTCANLRPKVDSEANRSTMAADPFQPENAKKKNLFVLHGCIRCPVRSSFKEWEQTLHWRWYQRKKVWLSSTAAAWLKWEAVRNQRGREADNGKKSGCRLQPGKRQVPEMVGGRWTSEDVSGKGAPVAPYLSSLLLLPGNPTTTALSCATGESSCQKWQQQSSKSRCTP